jgi:cullin 2
MFTDMSVSNDHNQGFHDHMTSSSIRMDMSFTVMILQAGAWPISAAQACPFTIPQELEHAITTVSEMLIHCTRIQMQV